MSLFQKGFLPKGRMITVVGRIKSVSDTWFNKKTGETVLRQHPVIHLEQASIPTGGLGPIPAKAQVKAPERAPVGSVVSSNQESQVAVADPSADQATAPVDDAPSYGEETLLDAEGNPMF